MDKTLLCLRDGILPAQPLTTKSTILGRSLGLTQPQAHHRVLGVLSGVMDANLLAGCLAWRLHPTNGGAVMCHLTPVGSPSQIWGESGKSSWRKWLIWWNLGQQSHRWDRRVETTLAARNLPWPSCLPLQVSFPWAMGPAPWPRPQPSRTTSCIAGRFFTIEPPGKPFP